MLRASEDQELAGTAPPSVDTPRLAPTRRPRRRRITLLVALLAVIAASLAGWVAGRQIESPAEVAARTEPPPLSVISVPVERRTLASEVTTRGTVRFGTPQTVTLPISALKPAIGVVTTAPTQGGSLTEGSVAMVVSGRPVFILSGAQPAYRDLHVGVAGDDVRQLEEALVRLGYDPGPVDGLFDAGTALAAADWYVSSGWSPMPATEEQLQTLRTMQTDRFTLESDLLLAQEGLVAARTLQTIAAERARSARVAADAAPAAEAAAIATAIQQKALADADVVAKMTALGVATDNERIARLSRDEALFGSPPTTGAALETLEAALRAATNSVITARFDLSAAQTAAGAIVTPVPGAMTDDLKRAASAAETERSQLGEGVTVSKTRVGLIEERIVALDVNLTALSDRLGMQIPADEVLFFPTLPMQVESVAVKQGDQLSGPVMTVANFTLAVDASLTVNDAKLVTVGARATVAQPDLALTIDGTVNEVATTPGTKGADPQRFYLGVTPIDAPASLVGASVVVTVIVESTDADVLAVPIAALSVASDGSSRVQVEADDGSTRYVTVTPGLAAGGLVEVTSDGELQEGDLVVVGTSSVPQGAS